MKKLFITTTLAITLSLTFVSVSRAAEITPDPSTYSYGSTSEFSPYRSLTTTTTTGEGLASTGDDTKVVFLIATCILLLSICGLYSSFYKQKA